MQSMRMICHLMKDLPTEQVKPQTELFPTVPYWLKVALLVALFLPYLGINRVFLTKYGKKRAT